MNKNEGITLILLVVASVFFAGVAPEYYVSLAFISLGFILTWLISLYLKNAGIIDIFWGLGFVVAALVYSATEPVTSRSLVVAGLAILWGLRLSTHILIRQAKKFNTPEAEDKRYQIFRKNGGTHFWITSLFKIFLLQAWMCWTISSTLWAGIHTSPGETPLSTSSSQYFTWLDILGLVIVLIGLTIESVADRQLSAFKNNPKNQGKLLTAGLWAWCRHPNYFGEALLWWGFYCFALANQQGWVVFAPALITFMLLRVSGVTLLEATLQLKPGFEEYQRSTPAFIPTRPTPSRPAPSHKS